jgi:biotin transport system substrate-specific component
MNSYANPVLSSSVPGRGTRVLADAIPGDRLRDILLVLAGAGLTALGAQISIHVPGSPVPVTGQTLGVVLAGASLGTWRGIASQLVYLVLGLMLPIYAGGTSGTAVLWGPAGGYIFGFVLAAGVVGWAAEHGNDRRLLVATVTFIVGQLAIYGIGIPWLKVSAGMSWGWTIHNGFTIFILGGLVKAVLAAIATPTAWRIERRFSSR